MTPNFDAAFKYLLGDEGSKYTNDPNDKGGPTKYGITKRTFEVYWKRPATDLEIENMTQQTAMTIYYYLFWTPLKLSEVTDLAIATALFDTAVLYSPKVAVLLAQKSLVACGRATVIDGLIGENTLKFLNGVAPYLFMTVYRARVMTRINAIIEDKPSDEKYRVGWTKRANRLMSLVSNSQGVLT